MVHVLLGLRNVRAAHRDRHDGQKALLRGEPPPVDGAALPRTRQGKKAVRNIADHTTKEGVASLLRDAAHPTLSDVSHGFSAARQPPPRRSAWDRAGVVDTRENYPIRTLQRRGINGGRAGEY